MTTKEKLELLLKYMGTEKIYPVVLKSKPNVFYMVHNGDVDIWIKVLISSGRMNEHYMRLANEVWNIVKPKETKNEY